MSLLNGFVAKEVLHTSAKRCKERLLAGLMCLSASEPETALQHFQAAVDSVDICLSVLDELRQRPPIVEADA